MKIPREFSWNYTSLWVTHNIKYNQCCFDKYQNKVEINSRVLSSSDFEDSSTHAKSFKEDQQLKVDSIWFLAEWTAQHASQELEMPKSSKSFKYIECVVIEEWKSDTETRTCIWIAYKS